MATATAMRTVSDEPELLSQLKTEARTVGAQRSFFASFTWEVDGIGECALLLDCEPSVCFECVMNRNPSHHPWLRYAALNTEPHIGHLLEVGSEEHLATDPATQPSGFGSALVVPVHGARVSHRMGALCLGYDDEEQLHSALTVHRLFIRGMAAELHDWCLGAARRRLLDGVKLSDIDLQLLQHQVAGHCTKRIATAMNLSANAVNSRFQRLNFRLRVPNRREAGRLAVENALLRIGANGY